MGERRISNGFKTSSLPHYLPAVLPLFLVCELHGVICFQWIKQQEEMELSRRGWKTIVSILLMPPSSLLTIPLFLVWWSSWLCHKGPRLELMWSGTEGGLQSIASMRWSPQPPNNHMLWILPVQRQFTRRILRWDHTPRVYFSGIFIRNLEAEDPEKSQLDF